MTTIPVDPTPQRALGKKPPKNAPSIPFAAVRGPGIGSAVHLETGLLHTVSHPDNYFANLGDAPLKMLYNDEFGVCVAVTTCAERRVSARTGDYPTDPEGYVAWIYRTQNPNFDPASSKPGGPDDHGMDIQTLLEDLHKNGDRDGHYVVAFARVDHTDIDQVRAACYEFEDLWVGQVVTDENQREFPKTCWDQKGTPEGGHSTLGYGYDPDRVLNQTWADKGCLTNAFVTDGNGQNAGVDEMWVVIWDDQAARLTDAQKAAWSAAYQELTGEEPVWPGTPGPQPTPPTPGPQPVDPAVAFVAAAEEWLTHHHIAPENKALEQPLRDYLATLT